jgi:RsiW-degrading membrane proteinase PrsW (M82 family)
MGQYLFAIARSRLYWGVLLFAIVPMLIEATRLNVVFGMLIYFSLFWFFVFRPLVAMRDSRRSITADIIAYVFTAIVGTSFAIFVESFWIANGVGRFLQTDDLSVSVPSFILFVGITEELAKQLVIVISIIFVRVHKYTVKPVEFMIMGISSGLGFSAVENISYVQKGLMDEVVHRMVGEGLVTALSRALYTPFLHGVWAGIAAFGLGMAAQRGRKYWWLAVLLLLVAASFHGSYDATVGTHSFAALLIVAVSYFLLLTLLLNGLRARYRRDGLHQN